jgi:glycogen(starch) synthase
MDIAKAMSTTGAERWMWRALLRNADAVIGCSRALVQTILASERAIERRCTVIHNGLDMDYLMNARNLDARVDPRLQGRSFILSVASYESKKGLDTLLLAFKRVSEDVQPEPMLALVGPEMGFGNELRQLAERLGLRQRVIFCGEVSHSDLHAYYQAASVFCLPSRAEPFGLVLLEAGAFRCPVVATTVGGIPEILTSDVNARLVPPDDPLALAAELSDLLRDRHERERLGNALFEHVQRHFPWASAYESYMTVACRSDIADREDGVMKAAGRGG